MKKPPEIKIYITHLKQSKVSEIPGGAVLIILQKKNLSSWSSVFDLQKRS